MEFDPPGSEDPYTIGGCMLLIGQEPFSSDCSHFAVFLMCPLMCPQVICGISVSSCSPLCTCWQTRADSWISCFNAKTVKRLFYPFAHKVSVRTLYYAATYTVSLYSAHNEMLCSLVLSETDRSSLPVIATVFDKLNCEYKKYLEAEHSYTVVRPAMAWLWVGRGAAFLRSWPFLAVLPFCWRH